MPSTKSPLAPRHPPSPLELIRKQTHTFCQSERLTERLWQKLDRGRTNSDGSIELPRWLVRNLADRHQIIGVTCNQVDHFIDKDSDMFDLAIAA
ncbi:hypothetical protein [Pseudomonas syringae]|uniref:Inorganic triphosphatase YgiF n=1 Tax=Pseudomonas syringae pv. actinidiae TaxID=103796 RepID=A0A2V0QAX2_PSESF|nr:hypothetical protein [Pseudomonas syringae]GBH09994.1 Inorganic triphosphatase YgiF [Pseudomonas syringae pv. actinidiae]